jgi:predicted nucleic acid-binding protein
MVADMLYLDTSALLKLYVREAGSDVVQAVIEAQDEPLPIWELQEMELINALRLKVFWKDITPANADRQIELFDQRKARGLYYFPQIHRAELQSDFRNLSATTPVRGCRTLDLLHVACALQLGARSFLTFDERQRNLASEFGLEVPVP